MGGIEIILGLQSLRSPPLDTIVVSLSALGSRYAYMTMLPAIYWLIDRRRGWVLALVFLLLMQVNALIKEITAVSRPFQVDQRVELIGPEPYTYAFPSGHAQGSTMIWGGLAAMNPWAVSVVVCVSVIFLVGLTRLYLGVHWPLDVGVGWIFGGLGLALMFLLFKLIQIYPESLKNWCVRLLWPIAGVGIIILCPSKDTVLAGATLAAAATLEYWERKWIGFDDCGKISQRIIRFASGFIPAGLLLALYKFIAFESLWIRGIFFFLMGGWMVLGAPYLFKKLKI